MSSDASHFLSPKPTSPLLLLQKRRPTTHHRRCESPTARLITSPEPPWLITPPTAPDNPFEHRIPNLPPNHSTTIPFSIRFIQLMKKKQQHLALTRPPNPANLGSASDAIWSLAYILENLQRSTLSSDAESAIARDTAVSVVWLFQRVFSSCPYLASEVLVIGSEFAGEMVKMLEREIQQTKKPTCWRDIGIVEPEVEQRPVKPTCWRDIGIMELEGGERAEGDSGSLDYGSRKRMYEHLIVTEKANSMILSNYAQLLYAYDNDLDRAEHYFKWSVSAEPVDGEARRKYAMFLWNARGDSEAAEEMFLAAIETEPWNSCYTSQYNMFLVFTGAWDTCHPQL